MDIRSLTCFRLAYECGSIGKAAKRAFLTRQGLSGILKGLEIELGQTLFIRDTHGLEPTETAQLVYPKIVELLEIYHDIEELCETSGPSQEMVGLGVAYGALLSLTLDDLLEEFEVAHPDLKLDVDIIEPVFAAQCVAEGSKDMALVAGPVNDPAVSSVFLYRVPLCAAVHHSLLPAEDEYTIESLQGVTWLGLDEHFPLDVALEEFSRARGLDLTMAYEWHDYHLILDQMRQGRGACIVPANGTEQFRQEGVVIVPFDDPHLTWDIFALLPRMRPLSRAAQTALAWLQTRFA